VRDLDAAAERFAALLGRPAALRSRHPRGTANALFLFPGGPYLELLAAWDAPERGASAAALERRLAGRGEGLHGLALGGDDLDADVAALRGRGVELADPVENHGTSADGTVRRWRATRLPSMLDEDAFVIQHLDAAWRTERCLPPLPGRERTAARSIHHVAFDLPDAEAASRTWEERYALPRVDGIQAERMGAVVLIHRAGDATVEFVGATRADGPVSRRMAARGHGLSSLAFEVDDLDGAVAAARAAGVAIGDPEPGVLPGSRVARIAPEEACGVSAQLLRFISPR
jgi:catechol 2,3-dioxygenase-like lactoylglutathione lyase family enzyme